MHLLIIHQAFITPNDAGGTRHYEFAKYLADKGNKVTVLTGDVSYISGSKREGIDEQNIQSSINIIYVKTLQDIHKSFLRRLVSFIVFMFSSLFAALKIKKLVLFIAMDINQIFF